MATSKIEAIAKDVSSAFTATTNVRLENVTATQIGNFVSVSFRARLLAEKSSSGGGWVQIATTSLRPSSDRYYPAIVWGNGYSANEVYLNNLGEIAVYGMNGKLSANNIAYIHMAYRIGQ